MKIIVIIYYYSDILTAIDIKIIWFFSKLLLNENRKGAKELASSSQKVFHKAIYKYKTQGKIEMLDSTYQFNVKVCVFRGIS